MKRRDALGRLVGGAAAFGAMRTGVAPAATEAEAAPGRKRAVRFAHLTDCHVYAKRHAAEGLAAAVKHVHALADRPEFILNGGDAVYDALEVPREAAESQWAIWKGIWKEHGTLPVRHCLGNHDVWGWSKAQSKTTGTEAGWGKQLALDQLGLEKSHYAFDAGGWRFIVLDSMTFDEQTAYRAELDGAQREWLAGELKSTPSSTPIVIVSHIPILTVGTVGFAPELRKHPEANKMLSHTDAFELVNLLREHPNVKLCLSGHTHLTESIAYAGIDFVNSGAVCGFWWKGKFHHTAEGYNVMDLYEDGTWSSSYTPYGWEAKA